MSFLERMFTIDAAGMLANVVTLALAFLVSLPVGWDRERANRIAGIRTFPLVAVASAGYVIIGRAALGETGDMHAYIVQGLMTGLGFLGGGVIIQARGDRVRGTATAVALWSTAAIGAAVAYSRLEVALLLAALDLVGLRLMRRVQKHIAKEAKDGAKGESHREASAP